MSSTYLLYTYSGEASAGEHCASTYYTHVHCTYTEACRNLAYLFRKRSARGSKRRIHRGKKAKRSGIHTGGRGRHSFGIFPRPPRSPRVKQGITMRSALPVGGYIKRKRGKKERVSRASRGALYIYTTKKGGIRRAALGRAEAPP